MPTVSLQAWGNLVQAILRGTFPGDAAEACTLKNLGLGQPGAVKSLLEFTSKMLELPGSCIALCASACYKEAFSSNASKKPLAS